MTDLTPAAQRIQNAQVALIQAQIDVDAARQAEVDARTASHTTRSAVQAAQKELQDALTALATAEGVPTQEEARAQIAAESAASPA